MFVIRRLRLLSAPKVLRISTTSHQVPDRGAVEQHDRADVDYAEDLKGFFRRDAAKDPPHQQRRQDRAGRAAERLVRAERQDSGEIQDMSAEEHRDPDEEDQLSLLAEDPPEVQHHVRGAAEDETCDDQLRRMRAAAAEDAEQHEAQRGQSFEHDRGDVLLLALLPEEYRGERETQRDQQDHASHILSFSCFFMRGPPARRSPGP